MMTSDSLLAYASNLPHLSMPIANSGDVTEPIAGSNNNTDNKISIKFGLPVLMGKPLDEDGIPVPRQELNGVFNMLSALVHYLMAGGQVQWSSLESAAIGGYPLGAVVVHNGVMYKSLAEDNTITPGTDATWENIDHLKLSGDTMTGPITTTGMYLLAKCAQNNGGLVISGDGPSSYGAQLELINNSDTIGNSDNRGAWVLKVKNDAGAAIHTLVGQKDGQLLYDGLPLIPATDPKVAMPDYSATPYRITNTTTYTATENCWLSASFASYMIGSYYIDIYVNGNIATTIACGDTSTDFFHWSRCNAFIPLSKGDVVSFSGVSASDMNGSVIARIFPCQTVPQSTPPLYCTHYGVNETTHYWYKEYSNGFCEQGGPTTEADNVVTLPKAFKDTDYTITTAGTTVTSKSTNTFTLSGASSWHALGYTS